MGKLHALRVYDSLPSLEEGSGKRCSTSVPHGFTSVTETREGFSI